MDLKKCECCGRLYFVHNNFGHDTKNRCIEMLDAEKVPYIIDEKGEDIAFIFPDGDGTGRRERIRCRFDISEKVPDGYGYRSHLDTCKAPEIK